MNADVSIITNYKGMNAVTIKTRYGSVTIDIDTKTYDKIYNVLRGKE